MRRILSAPVGKEEGISRPMSRRFPLSQSCDEHRPRHSLDAIRVRYFGLERPRQRQALRRRRLARRDRRRRHRGLDFYVEWQGAGTFDNVQLSTNPQFPTGNWVATQLTVQGVPEPGTFLALGAGLGLLALRRRK